MSERYLRHNLIDWFDQERLNKAKIVVVGAGAVGNEVIKNLALLGVGSIHIIDFDRIEEHNLTRCVLFRPSDVGRLKAEVAASSCADLNPETKLRASTSDFWDTLTFSELETADAVISCVDSYESRIGLNKLCLITSTDFYNTSIDSRYARVEAFPFSISSENACYECTLPQTAYENIGKRYSCGYLRKVAYEEKKTPTTAITSAIAGSIVSSLLLHRLCNHPNSLKSSSQFLIDTIGLNSSLAEIQRNEECVACGTSKREPIIIRAKRKAEKLHAIPYEHSGKDQIILSDPVVTTAICTICGYKVDYFECAKRLMDSITMCTKCDAQSIAPIYVERMPIYELNALFQNHPIPCKYLRWDGEAKSIIIELED